MVGGDLVGRAVGDEVQGCEPGLTARRHKDKGWLDLREGRERVSVGKEGGGERGCEGERGGEG